MSGVMLFKVELEADESAAVEVYPSRAIYGFRLPPFAEHRVWIYPVLMTAIGATIGFVAFGVARQIVRASRSARRSPARIRMRNRKGSRWL